ncbi:MAG TPA: hypothetical protein DCW90_09565 [Lachnospiraceae bacterium]|nr:hypothetical protein [uncultured Lachnoclostridium sp.]HAU85732.1 hypothetical protein [Lachnospiraceae bacterium]
MSNLSEVELSNLRHMLIFGEVDEQKNQDYANAAEHPEVKQFFQNAANGAKQNRQTLMSFLG